MENLKENIAIVTGAGQGIGEAIAYELAECGATVFVVDVNLDAARAVANNIIEKKGEARFLKVDVGDPEDVRNMVKSVIDEFDRIDILVNNVGISPKNHLGDRIPTIEIDHEQWDLVLRVNLKSVFLCTQYVVREMTKRGKGAILNISSISAKSGNSGPPAAHYCASKAGVANFTIYTAKELVQHGIRVNAIAPGTVQTAQRKGTSPKYNEILLKNIPMQRFAQPSEIARSAAFLVSDSASYITGEILDVNGGAYMD
ncbi:MAG: SDR family oxidoreductase [Desulfobacteraceae bacterium]|nr:MAG: SDR family oxidoreductase [Desulfobacteraceae bacterium]